MPVANNSVRWYHWLQAGAPQLAGVAGSAIALLDACLVNGFGSTSVDSAVVTANECTLNIAAGHSQIKDGVIRVSGVTTPAALNGDWKVKSVTASTVRFDTEGIADQTATGAIVAAAAPLGWQKPFSGTNLAAYKSSDPTSNGHYLRIDDSNAQEPRARGYVTMSDVNTGTLPFPTDAQVNGGFWWGKSATASAVTRPWILVGDGKVFHLWFACNTAATVAQPNIAEIVSFGEGVKELSTDTLDTFICGGTSTGVASFNSNASYNQPIRQSGSGGHQYAAGGQFGVPSAVQVQFKSDALRAATGTFYSGGNSLSPFPTPSGRLDLFKVWLHDLVSAAGGLSVSNLRLRSTVPGLFGTDVNCAPVMNTFDTLPSPSGSLAGRTVMTLRVDPLVSTSPYCGFVDLTGPWR